jgi:nucleotide-binding universal stress UspA family protein
MTAQPYRVVVGVDGTPAGVQALRWACRQAAAHGGVVDAVIAGVVRATHNGSAYRNDGERLLSEAIVVALGDNPRVAVRGKVVDGPAASALVRAADGADMLVLGYRGTKGLRRMVAGSTAQACLRNVRCPVTIVSM